MKCVPSCPVMLIPVRISKWPKASGGDPALPLDASLQAWAAQGKLAAPCGPGKQHQASFCALGSMERGWRRNVSWAGEAEVSHPSLPGTCAVLRSR